jgi:hypothetical protein
MARDLGGAYYVFRPYRYGRGEVEIADRGDWELAERHCKEDDASGLGGGVPATTSAAAQCRVAQRPGGTRPGVDDINV